MHIRTLLTSLLAVLALQAGGPKYERSLQAYAVPEVTLLDQTGAKVRLAELLKGDRPVILEFIFANCTTICPVMSTGYTNLQMKLGPKAGAVRLISISIDPENDTPAVMAAHLRRYRARPGWDFLAGSKADTDKVMKAFNAYAPNKMDHLPLTLIRTPGEARWVRINGLLSSTEFLAECRLVGIL